MRVWVWQTANGTLIPITEMQTSHIMNCMALIYRRRNWRREWLKRFAFELKVRSIMETTK